MPWEKYTIRLPDGSSRTANIFMPDNVSPEKKNEILRRVGEKYKQKFEEQNSSFVDKAKGFAVGAFDTLVQPLQSAEAAALAAMRAFGKQKGLDFFASEYNRYMKSWSIKDWYIKLNKGNKDIKEGANLPSEAFTAVSKSFDEVFRYIGVKDGLSNLSKTAEKYGYPKVSAAIDTVNDYLGDIAFLATPFAFQRAGKAIAKQVEKPRKGMPKPDEEPLSKETPPPTETTDKIFKETLQQDEPLTLPDFVREYKKNNPDATSSEAISQYRLYKGATQYNKNVSELVNEWHDINTRRAKVNLPSVDFPRYLRAKFGNNATPEQKAIATHILKGHELRTNLDKIVAERHAELEQIKQQQIEAAYATRQVDELYDKYGDIPEPKIRVPKSQRGAIDFQGFADDIKKIANYVAEKGLSVKEAIELYKKTYPQQAAAMAAVINDPRRIEALVVKALPKAGEKGKQRYREIVGKAIDAKMNAGPKRQIRTPREISRDIAEQVRKHPNILKAIPQNTKRQLQVALLRHVEKTKEGENVGKQLPEEIAKRFKFTGNLTQKTQEQIASLAEEGAVNMPRKGISFEELEIQAASLGLDPTKVQKVLRQLKDAPAAFIQLENFIKDAENRASIMYDLAKKTGDESYFIQAVAQERLYQQMIDTMFESASAFGRGLRTLRYLQKDIGTRLPPELESEIRLLKKKKPEEYYALLREMGDKPLPERLRILRKIEHIKDPTHFLEELIYNTVYLSNPYTWFVNFVGNTVNLGYTVSAGIIDSVVRGLSQKALKAISLGKYSPSKPRSPTAGMIAFASMMKSIPSAFRAARFTYKHEVSQFLETKLELEKHKVIPGKTGKVVRIPSRVMVATDEFMKVLARDYYDTFQAINKAYSEYARGLIKRNELLMRIDYWRNNLSAEEMAASTRFAARITFTEGKGENAIGEIFANITRGLQLMSSTNQATRIAKLAVMPFIRVITNITKQGAITKYSPLAVWAAEEPFNIGYLLMSLGTILTIWDLMDQGYIVTGTLATKDNRETAQQLGIGEYNFVDPNTGDIIDISRFAPLSNLIGLAADAKYLMEYATPKERENLAKALLNIFTAPTINSTFAKSIRDTLNMLSGRGMDPAEFSKNWIALMTSTGFERFWKSVVGDPNYKEAITFIEKIKARHPFLEKSLPNKYNVWGYPQRVFELHRKFNKDPFWVLIFNDKPDIRSPRPEISPPGLPQGSKKIELTAAEYANYKLWVGRNVEKVLRSMYNSGALQNMPPAQRRALYKRLFQKFRQVWQKAAIMTIPRIRQEYFKRLEQSKLKQQIIGPSRQQFQQPVIKSPQ